MTGLETRQLLKHKTYLALASFAEKRLETRDYTDPLDACLERIHQLNPAEERTARLFSSTLVTGRGWSN